MGQLSVYDSEGNEYGRTGSGRSNERISDFFFAGVRVAIDVSGRPELIVFFRARESNTGRSEQFYAVYEETSKHKLFESFKSNLERWVSQQGMTLVTDMDDVEVYRKLADMSSEPPGNETKHTVLKHILKRGERVRVGVRDSTGALAVFRHYLEERSAERIAIADESGGSTLSKYDLVIETGRYRGIESLGDTKQRFERAKTEVEDQIVASKISDIQSTVQDLQQTTSVSDAEIRRKLKSKVRVLDSPSRNVRGSSGNLKGDDPLFAGHLKIVTAAVLVLFAVIVAAAVATVFGPLSPAMIGLGDDGGAASLNVSAEQQDHVVHVNGTTAANNVTVELFKDGTSVSNRERVTVSNGTFDVNVTPETTGHLTAAVIPDGEKADMENATVAYESTATVSDLNATQQDGYVLVNGSSTGDEVDVAALDGDESVDTADSVAVTNGTFDVALNPSESGNFTVIASPYGQEAGAATTTVSYETNESDENSSADEETTEMTSTTTETTTSNSTRIGRASNVVVQSHP